MYYQVERLTFDDPAFRHIQTTVVITMVGSTRPYMQQLREVRPTRTVLVLHNCGLRTCPKDDVTTTAEDLWHANQHIFHMFRDEPLPILVLEDDVVFTRSLDAPTIEGFLARHPDAAYNLGGLPLVSYPVSRRHLRGLVHGFAHAVVYTAGARRALLGKKIRWLHDLELGLHVPLYCPLRPMAVQPIQSTENSRMWRLGGLSHVYLRAFGSRLFDVHHTLGAVGGLVPVVVAILLSILDGGL